MSLEDLGNIGELVAAVGVIISLVYLAVQIRQNTSQLIEGSRAQRLAAQRDVVSAFSRWRHLIAANPDISQLLPKGALNLESLSEEERIRFDLVAYELWAASETLFAHVEESLVPMERWKGTSQFLATTLRQPGLRRHWDENRHLWSSAFVAAVEESLSRPSAASPEERSSKRREAGEAT